nr:hypothetical protein [Mucilaginibacter sp. E4BP6]
MSTNPGKLLIYNLKFERPIPDETTECSDFHEYLKLQITGYRKLLTFEVVEAGDCSAKLRFWCNSTGRRGINRLKTTVFLMFPDVDITECRRERNHDRD